MLAFRIMGSLRANRWIFAVSEISGDLIDERVCFIEITRRTCFGSEGCRQAVFDFDGELYKAEITRIGHTGAYRRKE